MTEIETTRAFVALILRQKSHSPDVIRMKDPISTRHVHSMRIHVHKAFFRFTGARQIPRTLHAHQE